MNEKSTRILALVALTAIYFSAGWLGLEFAQLHPSASPVWFGTGIAFAAILVFGPSVWPAIFLGALLLNATRPETHAPLALNFLQAAGIATGNTLEALAGAWLVRRFAGGRRAFARVSGILGYTFLGAGLATTISATIGTATLFGCGLLRPADFSAVWLTWWTGDVVSAVLVAPLILIWTENFSWPRLSRVAWIEAACLGALLLLTCWFNFSGTFSDRHYPLAFSLIPFLVWAALRFGSRGVVIAATLISFFAVVGTSHGFGPFAVTTRNGSLLLLESFVCVITVAGLVLAAAVSEQQTAEAALRDEKEFLQQSQGEIRRLNAELERRVVERTAQLEATNRELEAFCYSVSHDLRAPLRAIHGFSEVLLEQYSAELDERGQDFLRRMAQAGTHMEKLIEDLLKLSRVSRGGFNLQTVDLSAAAEEIAAELRKAEPARAVEIAIAPGLTASGDDRLLRLVLGNLLGNAWKFTGRRDAARIEFGRAGDAFFVRDNGAGFDMTYVDKLFAVFQRLHSPAEFPGSGVGLAIVQRVINRHGGKVRAEGKVGAGATFYFTLPPVENALES